MLTKKNLTIDSAIGQLVECYVFTVILAQRQIVWNHLGTTPRGTDEQSRFLLVFGQEHAVKL